MQKQAPITDSNSSAIADDVFVVRKKYSQKKIRHTREKRRLSVSIKAFKVDLHIFDPEMRAKYDNVMIGAVMKLIFKKAAERIIQKLWRMPFPNGYGSLYMQQAQVTGLGEKMAETKAGRTALLNEVHYGLKRVFLKWNKLGKKLPYKHIWKVRRSCGFFRSALHTEVVTRAEDQFKPNYRGHLT